MGASQLVGPVIPGSGNSVALIHPGGITMQVLVNGLLSGAGIGLLGLAFAIAYTSTGVFHLALGAIYAAVPFVAASLMLRVPAWIAVPTAIVTGGLLSVGCEAVSHWKLTKKGNNQSLQLMASLGLYMIIVQAVAIIWGAQARSLRTQPDFVAFHGFVELTSAQLTNAGASIVASVSFLVWLRFTKVGLKLRALSDDAEELALTGCNVRRLRISAFAASGFLCGIGAIATAYEAGFDPNAGLRGLMLAVVALVIGSRQTYWGPLLGGMLIGILRSEIVWFFPAAWQDPAVFVILAIFLFFRPHGMLGKRDDVEALA